MGKTDEAVNVISIDRFEADEAYMCWGFAEDRKDVTIALALERFEECLQAKNLDLPPKCFGPSKKVYHTDCDANLNILNVEGRGRVNACLCNQGRYVSVTMRLQKKMNVPPDSQRPVEHNWEAFSGDDSKYILPTRSVVNVLNSLFSGFGGKRNASPAARYKPAQGLVVISGGTGSSKTQTAQALVLDYVLGRFCIAERIPHLLTFEDPIEPWKVYRPAQEARQAEQIRILDAINAPRFGMNFTARELKKDVDSLKQAIRDAKRQTPACMFIGEVRDSAEWKAVLEFAGSGHLAVVTTHAGSLIETHSRIIQALEAKTPAERGWIARQILGCVHIEKDEVAWTPGDGKPSGASARPQMAIFPAVWVGRPKAVNDLITDGLGALVPNGDYILSRQQFIKKALPSPVHASKHAALLSKALEFDLKEF
jgi:hypothetical protein